MSIDDNQQKTLGAIRRNVELHTPPLGREEIIAELERQQRKYDRPTSTGDAFLRLLEEDAVRYGPDGDGARLEEMPNIPY